MRRWKDVGSVENIPDDQGQSVLSNRSRSRSHKSRGSSPFTSFRMNIQNQSQEVIDSKDKVFCHEFMERKKEVARTMTIEMGRDYNHKKSLRGEDMFTEMRNVLRDEENTSKGSIKSLSDPQSKLNTQSKEKGKDTLKKTSSKLKTLKKQQVKLKKSVETDLNAIKNVFFQLQEVYHNYKPSEVKESSSRQSCDTQFLRDILEEAISVERHFKELDRKKMEIMRILEQN